MNAISIADAMASPKLYAPHFGGGSWNLWKAVLKATFAEPMSDDERKAFAAVAEREPPKRRVSEAVYIVGRGGGKDSVASLIAAYIAMSFEPKGRLRAGEKAVVMLLAVDRQQASIVFGYIAGLFTEIAALAALVKNIGAESIELNNNVVVDHGRTGHDDLCNAAAGALVLASRRPKYDSSLSWVSGDTKENGEPPFAALRSIWEHPFFQNGGPR